MESETVDQEHEQESAKAGAADHRSRRAVPPRPKSSSRKLAIFGTLAGAGGHRRVLVGPFFESRIHRRRASGRAHHSYFSQDLRQGARSAGGRQSAGEAGPGAGADRSAGLPGQSWTRRRPPWPWRKARLREPTPACRSLATPPAAALRQPKRSWPPRGPITIRPRWNPSAPPPPISQWHAPMWKPRRPPRITRKRI